MHMPLAPKDIMTREQLVSCAVALAPRLTERAAACAVARRVPPETIKDFQDAGLFRIAQPRRYGGLEMGWDVLCEISQILARADGAQAWIHRIFSDHAQMVSTFSVEAQDDVWGQDTHTMIAASFDPAGRARRCKGGFNFSGKHGFASGIDYAQWLICGGFIETETGLDGPHFFLN